MAWKNLSKSILGRLWPPALRRKSAARAGRGPVDHVIILDGTMSSLHPEHETNAGRAYRLLSGIGGRVLVYYEAGVQWQDWRSAADVMMGRGINRQIRRAYGYLASRYRPGDRIFLLGYSRGAFAVRSLAGVIDQVGLLRHDCATERNVNLAYRHYRAGPCDAAGAFGRRHCHASAPIEMVGVWDTVKALGLRLPILWRWSEPAHAFHNHNLGHSIRHGFHALALDETREVFEPVMWTCPEGWTGRVEQVWFPGAHGDVGGQLGRHQSARPLANIPFVWMMQKIEGCGIALPEGWQRAYPTDATAPSVGTWSSWGKLFLLRSRRVVGHDRSEHLHESVAERDAALASGEPVV